MLHRDCLSSSTDLLGPLWCGRNLHRVIGLTRTTIFLSFCISPFGQRGRHAIFSFPSFPLPPSLAPSLLPFVSFPLVSRTEKKERTNSIASFIAITPLRQYAASVCNISLCPNSRFSAPSLISTRFNNVRVLSAPASPLTCPLPCTVLMHQKKVSHALSYVHFHNPFFPIPPGLPIEQEQTNVATRTFNETAVPWRKRAKGVAHPTNTSDTRTHAPFFFFSFRFWSFVITHTLRPSCPSLT